MIRAAIVFVLIFCRTAELVAQQSKIDSPKRKIVNAKADSSKVKLYLELARDVVYQDARMGIYYNLTAARLAKKIHYTRGAALGYMNLASSYSIISIVDTSLMYMDSALVFLRELNSPDLLAVFFANRADTYVQISDFKKALLDCDTATIYAEANGNKMRLSYIYNVRADIYWHLKQYKLNGEFVDKALKLHQETGNTRMIAQAYADKGDWHTIHKTFDKAVSFYKMAIHIADSIQDENNLSRYHSLLSDAYLEMKKKNEAAASALLALKYAQEEDNPVQEASVHTLLCRIYTRQANSAAAIGHGRIGHFMAMQEIDFPLQQSSAAALATAFKKSGNMDSAYHYLQLSKDLNDSLITKNFNNETANLQISFDVAQKEKQIELMAKDKELQQQKLFRQRLLFAGAAALLVLVLVGVALLLNRNKLKQRMKELELRNQIAADLHDEVGSSLSSIHMLSQMASKQGSEATHKDILERMSSNAKETMDKMGDFVWMIKPGETEAGSLKQRMERFAYEICGSKSITASLQIDDLERIKLSMEQRKNIYLIFKEAVNNAVKYSGAEKIEVTAVLQNKELILEVKDFGNGFDSSLIKKGNGLDNMRHRARELDGDLNFSSAPGEGTLVKLVMPI